MKKALKIAIFLLLLAPAGAAFADVVQNSAAGGLGIDASSGSQEAVGLGNGITGVLTDIRIDDHSKAGSLGDWDIWNIRVSAYTDGTYATPVSGSPSCGWQYNNSSGTVHDGIVGVGDGTSHLGAGYDTLSETTSGCTANPAYFYKLTMYNGSHCCGSPYFQYYGVTTSSDFTNLADPFSMAFPYFDIRGWSPTPPITSSAIGPLDPGVVVGSVTSTTTSSNTVTMSIPYQVVSTDPFNEIYYLVLDQSYSRIASSTLPSSGGTPLAIPGAVGTTRSGTLTFSFTGQTGHQYVWYAGLYATSTTASLESDQFVFWSSAQGVAGIPVVGSLDGYTAIATSTCEITNVSGCFQNALTWAFYPPSGAFNGVLSLWTLVSAKPPFGYFTVAKNDISTLGGTASSTFTLASMTPINTYIFGPIDTALAALWWAIFGIWFFFHRVRHIEI